MRLTALLGCAAAVALVACEAGPVTEPEVFAPDAPSLDAHGAVIHTVAGGGTLNYFAGDELYGIEHYGFNAKLHADGTATGQLQATWDWPDALDRLHAEIVCLEVDGNQAGVVIRLTRAQHVGIYSPFPEGLLLGFAVRDNGEGEGADEISYFYGPIANPPLACHNLATGEHPQFEWTSGNVKVR